jgi:hypothetical protein
MTRIRRLMRPARLVLPKVVPRAEPPLDAEAIAGLRDFVVRSNGDKIEMHPATMLAILDYVDTIQADADRWRHMRGRLRLREHRKDDTGWWLHLVPIEVNHFLCARESGAPRDVDEAVDALRGAVEVEAR